MHILTFTNVEPDRLRRFSEPQKDYPVEIQVPRAPTFHQQRNDQMTHLVRTSVLAIVIGMASQGVYAAQDNDDFVEDASAKGVAEVEAGKLAQEKGTAADVKSFAEMMIKDHSAANDKLKTLATSKNLEVSDDAQLMDKAKAKAMILELRSAKSFDQAYANNQVKAHEATIKLFEEEAANGKDADLKAFATETLPKLKAHLSQAQALAKAHGGDAAQ
jgi:putative membrane protein